MNSSASLFFLSESLIKDAGLGLFAKMDIEKNKCLGEYRGELLSREKFLLLSDRSYVFQLTKNLFIDGKSKRKNTPLRYINHQSAGKSANVQARINIKKRKILFYTKRKISAGEELYLNYGYDPSKHQNESLFGPRHDIL